MRVVRYNQQGGPATYGILEADAVVPASGSLTTGFAAAGAAVPLGDVRLLAPVVPRTVMCVGRNYAEHVAELGNELPPEPLVFMKPASSIIGPDDEVHYPSMCTRVDHEAEIVAVIGRDAHRVHRDDALHYVFGYTLGNDVTDRLLQKSDVGGQWTRAKGFHTFCSVGPWIDTDVVIGEVDINCTVNGEVRQEANTRDLIFPIPVLIEFITRFTKLEAGDIIFTGTPSGVSPMQIGDKVSVFSSALGSLDNVIVAEP